MANLSQQSLSLREVEVGEMITVGELAQRMAVKSGEVIKTLMGLGVMATINQPSIPTLPPCWWKRWVTRSRFVSDDALEEQHVASLQIDGDAESRAPWLP